MMKNNFMLLLQKGVYPYKYMDYWEEFSEMLLPEKYFQSDLNTEDSINIGYAHGKGVCKDFEKKNQ